MLAAQRAQLDERRARLESGAAHVGWKLAYGIPGADELVGGDPLFGYLTSATRLESGSVFDADGIRRLQVDCELAVELGRDVAADDDVEAVRGAVVGFAAALELCDVGRPPDDFDGVVAADVFHRAFALGPPRPAAAAVSLGGRVHVNGELRHESPPPRDNAVGVLGIARLLEAVGERIRGGDRVICGAICGGLIQRGDDVVVTVGDLGAVRVAIAPVS